MLKNKSLVIISILYKCIAMYHCNIVYTVGQTEVGVWSVVSHHVTIVPDMQYMFCSCVAVLLSTARRTWREVHICGLLRSEAIQIKKRCGIYHAGVLFVCLFIWLVSQCLLMWVHIETFPFSPILLILSLTLSSLPFPFLPLFSSSSSSSPFPLQAIHTTLTKHYNDTLNFVLAVNATKPVPITVVQVSLLSCNTNMVHYSHIIYIHAAEYILSYYYHFCSLMHTNNCMCFYTISMYEH